MGASHGRYNVWREMNDVFNDISAYRFGAINLTGIDAPEQLQWAQVSANYFHLFGQSPERGRVFTAKEDRRGASNFAVISDALWKRDFGGDPHTLNKTISLSGAPYVVVAM
jgi:putative ABC transport system permease protein